MVQVGDWVKVKRWGYHFVGFVECIWKNSIQITNVLRIENGEMQKIGQQPGTYHHSQVEPLQCDIHPEDLRTMIDIALDTRDKEWFEELMRRWKNEFQ
jgi:uncharacterized protein YpiB (UPF0302 family)